MTPTRPAQDLDQQLQTATELLNEIGQGHLLQFAGELDPEALEELLMQIDHIDMRSAAALIASARDQHPETPPLDKIHPANVVPREPANAAEMTEVGHTLLKEGKVAAFTVAGGQGTRLGWNGPKGTYPATPLTGKPLFRLFAEQLNAMRAKTGKSIPWYIMTSPINDADTRAFFRDNNYFGLERTDIFMFPQGVLPSFDDNGKFMLSAKNQIAVNPDGHGGALRALRMSGAIEDMRARGIEQVSYFQVDNPTVHVVDPLFLGLHVASDESSGEMSSKMVPKVDAAEKVGVFCSVDGRTQVIEYSDLPEELSTSLNDDGSLRFIAGSIAIHALSVDFIDRLTADEAGSKLPLHHARKAVPFISLDTGERVAPDAPNATKLEMFIFDAIPHAERSMVYETDRVEEFAPIKNAHGVDSADSSHDLQTERAARWLEFAGVEVPRGDTGTSLAAIEITAERALCREDMPGGELPESIEPGDQIVL